MSSKYQYNAVCNECGGEGCVVCQNGWQCTMDDIGSCYKCAMGLKLGKKSNERGSTER